MLRAYRAEDHKLREIAGDDALIEQALGSALWVDLQEPTDAEREKAETLYKKDLPEAEEVEEIEDSARFFIEGSDIHVHSLYLLQSEGMHDTETVAFILKPERLLTIRDSDIADFRLMRLRIRRGQIEATTPLQILVSLFEQKVENLADNIEDIHGSLEQVSAMVLSNAGGNQLENAIDRLAKLEDSNGRVRLCLMDTQRSLSFLQRHIRQSPEDLIALREVMRDLDALMSHTTFLFEKINFLMDAAQGFINIEQNQIIKIFSIAAVVFLPPTLVASAYGMNFDIMPELHWEFGYPFALLLMVISGIAPYWYFKRKDWL
ncbi:MAG: magnesium/cobalt transporter CorA [Pseudomonadota bacterium]